MLTLEEYAMGRDRDYPDEWETAKPNAINLLSLVNAFLDELGYDAAVVSSGFRPSAINAATPNAAKNSLHKLGKAVDIADHSGLLRKLLWINGVSVKADLLRKYNLWMENPEWTSSWIHLDIGDRMDRTSRTFKP